MWAADVFITKSVTIYLFIVFILTRKYQASLQKKKKFSVLIKKKTVIQKNCYLLSAKLHATYCANENTGDNKEIKYFLQENSTSAREIHGNSIVVHAHEVNLVDYAIASIIGR